MISPEINLALKKTFQKPVFSFYKYFDPLVYLKCLYQLKRLPHPADKPDPKAAQALQEGLGGQLGEMRTMMQYFFQNMYFRCDAKPHQDLLRSMATEEMGHVEQITNTINVLLEGASVNSNQPNELLPLSIALDSPNIHHFLVAGQSARPVDAAGNPWSASYVYDGGNLVLNMFYNLMLECTGRLQNADYIK